MTLLDTVIGLHIAAGLTAVVTGALAMLAAKKPGRHPRAGRTYLIALTVVALSAVGIVTQRPDTAFLLVPGGLGLAAAGFGFMSRRIRWRGWLAHHNTAMGSSYILTLTAFYVDNGPRLPVWELLPPITFWFLPAVVGAPPLWWALHRWRHGRSRA